MTRALGESGVGAGMRRERNGGKLSTTTWALNVDMKGRGLNTHTCPSTNRMSGPNWTRVVLWVDTLVLGYITLFDAHSGHRYRAATGYVDG